MNIAIPLFLLHACMMCPVTALPSLILVLFEDTTQAWWAVK